MPKKLSAFKRNPANPRTIKDSRFKQLCQSIKDFPKMMELRPMIYDSTKTIIGGNQRFEACKANGMTEVPDSWLKSAADLTEEERRRFIVTDNNSFGQHDWDELANVWDTNELIEWGLEIPHFPSTAVTFQAAEKTGLKVKATLLTGTQVVELTALFEKWGVTEYKFI